jgi:hypothetical protein
MKAWQSGDPTHGGPQTDADVPVPEQERPRKVVEHQRRGHSRRVQKGIPDMRNRHLVAFLAVATLGLSACSEKTQQETSEAAAAASNDVAATGDAAVETTSEAVNDAAVATDRAGESVEAGAERAGAAVNNGADAAADATGSALRNTGEAIRD